MAAGLEWNDVWAEYDARQPARPSAAQAPRPKPVRVSARRAPWRRAQGRGGAWSMLSMLPLLAAAWVGLPYATAWQLAQAIEGRDEARLSRHIDLAALQAAIREALHLGPGAPEGEQASAFLGAMANEMAAAWASPAALADVAQARGVARGVASEGWRWAVPIGLTRFEMPLASSVAPLTLQMELKGEGMAPRWQVTGVRLQATAPAAAPGPRLRLSELR